MLPLHRTKNDVFNYDEIPPGYYYKAIQSGNPVQRFWHREKFLEVARIVSRSNATNLLDVGCGPGSFLSILGNEVPSINAIGVDVASPQIDFAIKNIEPSFSDKRISFRLMMDGALPFQDSSFDAVTCIEVVEHIHPFLASRMLQEIRRVLRPEGTLVLTTPNYRSFWPLIEFFLEKASPVKYHEQHISKFTPNSLLKFLESNGFEPVNINSMFIAAPFLSGISLGLASAIHKFELRAKPLLGSLLVIEAKAMNWPAAPIRPSDK